MRFLVFLIGLLIKFSIVQNRSLSFSFVTVPTFDEADTDTTTEPSEIDLVIPVENYEDVIPMKNYEDLDSGEYAVSNKQNEVTEKPCSIVVLSNMQNPNMQSLLRKYRYDANGMLIPSSVKYFIKLPQGFGSPLLVPLNDNAYSPLGGFVRYYKEVPPIPHTW